MVNKLCARRTAGNSFIIATIVLLLATTTVDGAAPPLDAAAILSRCDEAEGYQSSYSEIQQDITTSSGDVRTLEIRGWAVNNGEKQLSEYLSPADIRGQKILITNDGDDIWMFNPETRRTRKLGSHMKKRKVMGSDFSYEDMAGGKMSEKYKGSLIGEEEQEGTLCYILDLKPTPKGPSYSKIKIWIGKEDFLSRRIDFFQNNETEPFKRLTCTDIRKADDKLYPHTFTMTNLEDRTKTVDSIKSLRFGIDIPPSIFESRNLSR